MLCRVAFEAERLEELFRGPHTPWAVNLSNDGSRMILVADWLEYAARELSDGSSHDALEAATDAYVEMIGGNKVRQSHPLNGLRCLAGRKPKERAFLYEIPSSFFGSEPFGIADQMRAAADARAPQRPR